MDHLQFTMENHERILAVENSFMSGGVPLLAPGRVLIGEGRLMKLCRRKPQPKAFFLFNDILVYGTIMVPGRWNSHQQILHLEELEQENLEDGLGMSNQWLLRTPRKSFHVSAASPEEKQAWMKHIEQCRVERLKQLRLPAAVKPFAAIWIPDDASAVCMRCTEPFNVTQRRHHCRCCGFVVCNSCSKSRAILIHISSKPVRVCRMCKDSLTEQKVSSGAFKKEYSMIEEMPEYDQSSDEEQEENHKHTAWFNIYREPESLYTYFNPQNIKHPQL